MNSTNSPKMGWLCSYTPIEIIHAAGFVAYGITGHSDPIREADSHMHTDLCQYVRSILDIALEEGYNALEGVIFVNSCDAMRRLFDVWKKFIPLKFMHIIDLPTGRTDADLDYLKNEYQKLKTALEEYTSTTIEEDDIKNSMKIFEKSRTLYDELNKQRANVPPRISGKTMMELGMQFFTEAPEAWNQQVEKILKEEAENIDGKPRILLSGSPINTAEIIGFIEECDLSVVYEDLCTSCRMFDLTISNTGDPLTDLSRAYLNRSPCARMMRIEERVKTIIELVKEFKVDGIIHHSLKFCDTYLYDVPFLKNAFSESGIKTLFIEGDCTLGSFSQLRTRIEAFAEILRGDE